MNILQLSLLGVTHPTQAFDNLKTMPAPASGFWAILFRWVGTSVTVGVLAWLILRIPTTPSYLAVPFLADQNYYLVSIFWSPIFGLCIWLLWSAVAHVLLRFTGYTSNFDQLLNMIGLASLIPAPFIWLLDSLLILLHRVRSPEAGAAHMLLALWGMSLLTIGFKRNLHAETIMAVSLSILLLAIYIPLAMLWIR